MAVLVTATQVFFLTGQSKNETWMARTSPAKTEEGQAPAETTSFRAYSLFRWTISTSSSCSGEKSVAVTSNSVGEIFFTPEPQKLTSASGSPLSTTSRNDLIGEAQLLAVV